MMTEKRVKSNLNPTRTVCFDSETSGLEPFIHRILCITVLDVDTLVFTSFCEDDEQQLLINFMAHVKDVKSFIGYNSQSFDAPFILQRCMFYGIKISKEFLNINNQIDLRKHCLGFFLSYNKFQKGKLCQWAEKFGLPVDTEDGSKMPSLYLKKCWSEIEAHCVEDVKITKALYDRAKLCGVL